MHNPLVSIIIPVYNNSIFIKDCIEDLCRQTFKNIEIIIVDDGSTDNSFEIAKQFEKDNIKVYRQQNAGAAVARNTGLAHAKGSFIQFMDIDDFLSHSKIEKQVNALIDAPDKVAVCNYVTFANSNEIDTIKSYPDQTKFIYSTEDTAEFLLNLWGANGGSYFIQTNCWLVPRSIIEKAGRWRQYKCPDDDGEFFTRVLLASIGIIHTPGQINYYRHFAKQKTLSANKNFHFLKNSLLSIDLKEQYLIRYKNRPGFARAFARQYLNYAVYNYPEQKLLSEIALKRFRRFGVKMNPPLLGNKFVEILKYTFGWRLVRLLKYYFGA